MKHNLERILEFLAFALLVAAVIAVWFVTPAHAETTAMRGPSGANVYTTKCSGSEAACYQEASANCRGGSYQILASHSNGGGILMEGWGYGPVTYYTMSYQCGRSDGRMASFPRTGPVYVPPRPFVAECSGNGWGVGCAGWR